MSISCFLDKDHPPTEDELRAALGAQYPLWEQLQRFVLDTYGMPGEMNFGGKKYGWNLWFRRSGKSLVSLYPQQNHLVAQVVLGQEQAEQALLLTLGSLVRQALESTPQLHDGRWLFIAVLSEQDALDVQQLLLVKKHPPKRNAGG